MNKNKSHQNNTKRLRQQEKYKPTTEHKWGEAMRKSFNQNLNKKIAVV